jgi:hypothetical protein
MLLESSISRKTCKFVHLVSGEAMEQSGNSGPSAEALGRNGTFKPAAAVDRAEKAKLMMIAIRANSKRNSR